jgi:hypothetical protein
MFTKLSLKGANTFRLFFLLALIFSPFASAIAFILTYTEYVKHVGKKRALRHGLEMALTVFILFVFLSILASFFVEKIV